MCPTGQLEDPEEQRQPYEQLGEGNISPPEDHYNVAYIIFYIQGIGQLFPWNAFITAGSYYRSRFCGSVHSRDFENYFSLTFMGANLISQALLLKYDALVASMWSTRARMTVTLGILSLIFLTTTLLVLDPSTPPLLVFHVTEACVALCGIGTSFLQASMFGYAARFPPPYTQALMAGQGLAGLIVSIAAIATAAAPPHCPPPAPQPPTASMSALVLALGSGPASHDTCTPYTQVDGSSLAYFACAVLVLLTCLVTFLLLQTLPFARFYSSPCPPSSIEVLTPSSSASLTELVTSPSSSSLLLPPPPSHTKSSLNPTGRGGGWGEQEDTEHHNDADQLQEEGGKGRGQARSRLIPPPSPSSCSSGLCGLLWSVRHCGLAVVLVFLVTLSVFPSLTQHITARKQGSGGGGCEGDGYVRAFVPLQFLLFNLMDWVGRSLPGLCPLDRVSPVLLPPLSLLRLVLVPLFLLCHVEDSAFPTLLHSDAWPLGLMVLFATSNGYLSSLAMMHGPRCVADKGRQREVAGSAMVLLLTLGLSIGSAASFLVSAISDGSLWHGR